MATTDFEARQLLKAYRKGLISDELFEEQMQELRSDPASQGYSYNGKSYETEKELVLGILDEFRCAEDFAAEYLNRWVEVSDQECVKGGLRVVQQREAYHAQILEERLRELGGSPQCSVPAERREKELPFFASTDSNDIEKLQSIAAQLKDPVEILKPLTDAIGQIQDDQHSKELLGSLVDDELSSVKWLMGACETLSK
ncbi:MAG: hypothetical protein J4F42_00650 [Desulfurellaceae bacterium]|nr:hypothetical protein [Desulfurellaceae bacterium]